jgi:nucleoside-diphosphate-sugar epimerase
VRVVVIGATGNVGTSLLRALADEQKVTSIVGIARRLPAVEVPKTEFVAADISTSRPNRFSIRRCSAIRCLRAGFESAPGWRELC